MRQLAIIGGGFMGAALAQGLVDSGWQREKLVIAELREARRHFIQDELKIPCLENPREAAASAASVLFAVKPQDLGALMAQVAPAFTREKLAISIAAGVKIGVMEKALNCPVIRCMPNTPAAIGAGVTALARGKFATDTHLMTALNILSAVGKTIIVDENQMDAVTAVSGTGPAYVFYLAEALIDAAMARGPLARTGLWPDLSNVCRSQPVAPARPGRPSRAEEAGNQPQRNHTRRHRTPASQQVGRDVQRSRTQSQNPLRRTGPVAPRNAMRSILID